MARVGLIWDVRVSDAQIDELIEVALQVAFPEAVEHPLRPSLHVGEHAVNPMQDLVRASAGDDPGLMRVRGRVLVAEPPVRDDMRARLDGAADEAVQRLRRPVGDVFHADTARLSVGGQFHRAHYEHLAHRAAPALRSVVRIVPRPERHLRFVDFHEVCQRVAVRVDHGATQSLQQKPRRLVTAQPELCLKLQRRHAVGMAGHDVRREKPCPERQMAGVHHRPGCDRGLASATGAFRGRALALQGPAFAGAARGTNEALRPAPVRQILRTRVLVVKARIERLTGHRSVGFPTGWHERNNIGTPAPCDAGNSTSCRTGVKGISLPSMHINIFYALKRQF